MFNRHDYAYPFRIDPASGQAAQTRYEAHVEQMILQVLLTSPGERADLPDFGCGLRQLLFAPLSDALTAATQILVQQALERWLAGEIKVSRVSVLPPEQVPDQAQLWIEIDYRLIETLSIRRARVLVV